MIGLTWPVITRYHNDNLVVVIAAVVVTKSHFLMLCGWDQTFILDVLGLPCCLAMPRHGSAASHPKRRRITGGDDSRDGEDGVHQNKARTSGNIHQTPMLILARILTQNQEAAVPRTAPTSDLDMMPNTQRITVAWRQGRWRSHFIGKLQLVIYRR